MVNTINENTKVMHENTIYINEDNFNEIFTNMNIRWGDFTNIENLDDFKIFIESYQKKITIEYENIRYFFKKVVFNNDKIKIICNAKFLWDEFEPHTMNLGEILLILNFKHEKPKNHFDKLINMVKSFVP
jgi:hypothetical protein